MRQETISIDDLMPTERYLRDDVVERYSKSDPDKIINHHYPVVPYEDGFILCDGHHRICYLAHLGKKRVNLRVIETDDEVKNSESGILFGLNQVDEAIEKYESLRSESANSIKELLDGYKIL